ncbi:hypothetical protein GCM10010121_061450 [Streptomyces brasiliensis]|uniref:DDE Tnp4 domain-containing protein n=1 Tax=Streptomyces brasiliensis TaxID=1954 RepID=A0A917NYY8_9ACTN|nr:hypothetical protein GCM10010121_061450 [Streptomyces brasiliensis]
MTLTWVRAACSHPALCGASRAHFGVLLEELAPKWEAARESALLNGAVETDGGRPEPGPSSGWSSSTGSWPRWCTCAWACRTQPWPSCTGWTSPVRGDPRSRRQLTARGFAVPDRPGPRLRTLEDLFAYADAEGVELRLDGTEVQVRRPRAGRPGREAFVSGKKKQNTIKTTTFSDAQGRMLFSGVVRPGRMHDQTVARSEGIAEQLRRHPTVKAEVDEGYRGLANEFPDQVSAPPRKPKDDTPLGEQHAWRDQRRRQSSARIHVEHANAELKQWRPLQRFTGRRETHASSTIAGRAVNATGDAPCARRRTHPECSGCRTSRHGVAGQPSGRRRLLSGPQQPGRGGVEHCRAPGASRLIALWHVTQTCRSAVPVPRRSARALPSRGGALSVAPGPRPCSKAAHPRRHPKSSSVKQRSEWSSWTADREGPRLGVGLLMLKAVEEHAHEPVEQVALGGDMAVSGFTPTVVVGSGAR